MNKGTSKEHTYKQPNTMKVTKPNNNMPQRPLTEEEKKTRIMQFLQQKREQFSINILCNLCQGAVTNKIATNFQVESLVGVAVKMADELIEKLYPLPEEESK